MAKASKERLTMPKRPPYELVDDYLMSKLVTHELCKPYKSGDNICEISVSNSNFIARYELYRMEKMLRNKRDLAAQKKEELDKQWDDLQKREDSLRDMFINFNGFIMDNNEKRTRAAEKLTALTSVHKKRDKQIEDLKRKCYELKRVKEEMTKKIEDYKVFEDFLTTTARTYSEDFDSILAILNRYEVIKHTSEDLMKQHEVELNCLAKTKREFSRTVDRCVVTLSGLTTRVALLRERFDAARRECRRWEELLLRVGGEAWHRHLDLIAIKDSCRRIHLEACRRRGVKPAPDGDFVAQLEGIRKALLDYRNVNEMARRAREEELAASERARPSSESV